MVSFFLGFKCTVLKIGLRLIIVVYAQTAFSSTAGGLVTDVMVETYRRKHLAYLMADQGVLVNPDSALNLPKQVGI